VARRIGYGVMRVIGASYPRLLFSMIMVVLILNFLVPSGLADYHRGADRRDYADKTSTVQRGSFAKDPR